MKPDAFFLLEVSKPSRFARAVEGKAGRFTYGVSRVKEEVIERIHDRVVELSGRSCRGVESQPEIVAWLVL